MSHEPSSQAATDRRVEGFRRMVTEMVSQTVSAYQAHCAAGIIVYGRPNPERMVRRQVWDKRQRRWQWVWAVKRPINKNLYARRADVQELCEALLPDGPIDKWLELVRLPPLGDKIRHRLGLRS